MPRYPRHEQGKTQQDGCPKHRTPFFDDPSPVTQGPESHVEVSNVANEERGEQAEGNLLLQDGVLMKVSATCSEDEEVDKSY